MRRSSVLSLGLGPTLLKRLDRFDWIVGSLGPGVEETEIAVAQKTPVNEAALSHAPNVKLVIVVGSGYDNVDLAFLRQRRISLANSPGGTADCVADHAIGILLATCRKILQGDRFVRSREWGRREFPMANRFSGKRLGILGLGSIGMAVAKRAAGFALEVGYHNRLQRDDSPYVYFTDLTALALWADYLVICCRADSANVRLIGRPVLEALGPDGVLVNVSRGSVIDEPALVACLRGGNLGAAALDVFDDEPDISADILAAPNTVLTPHLAGRTIEVLDEIAFQIGGHIEAFSSHGHPLSQFTVLDMSNAT